MPIVPIGNWIKIVWTAVKWFKNMGLESHRGVIPSVRGRDIRKQDAKGTRKRNSGILLICEPSKTINRSSLGKTSNRKLVSSPSQQRHNKLRPGQDSET